MTCWRATGRKPAREDSPPWTAPCPGDLWLVHSELRAPRVTATRFNPVIAGFYHRLRTTGHPGKVALTAAMRKLLTILNAILRDHRPWQPA